MTETFPTTCVFEITAHKLPSIAGTAQHEWAFDHQFIGQVSNLEMEASPGNAEGVSLAHAGSSPLDGTVDNDVSGGNANSNNKNIEEVDAKFP